MRRTLVASLFALSLLGGLVLAGSPEFDRGAALASDDPCAAASGDPGPPSGEPEPFISGTVIDAGSQAGLSGLTVKLYRCVAGSGTQVASQTTGSGGAFAFTGLSDPYWYYVQVVTTDLPASPTLNPTAPIAVGDGEAGMVLSFQ